jgi:hypothetical protein
MWNGSKKRIGALDLAMLCFFAVIIPTSTISPYLPAAVLLLT